VAVGYVFSVGDRKIYFAGDTALTMEMKLLEDLNLLTLHLVAYRRLDRTVSERKTVFSRLPRS